MTGLGRGGGGGSGSGSGSVVIMGARVGLLLLGLLGAAGGCGYEVRAARLGTRGRRGGWTGALGDWVQERGLGWGERGRDGATY